MSMFQPYPAIWRIRDEGEPEIYQKLTVLSPPRSGGYVDTRWVDRSGIYNVPVKVDELIGIDDLADQVFPLSKPLLLFGF